MELVNNIGEEKKKMANYIEKIGDYPYYLRAGFFIFLLSERERHKRDIEMINGMLEKLEEITPALKDKENRKSLVEFSKQFVDF